MDQRREADAAVADDDRGHALADLGQHLRRRQHDLVVVRVHVDEARRDDHSRRVDDLRAARAEPGADRSDATVLDAHVSDEPRRPAAVDDGAAA